MTSAAVIARRVSVEDVVEAGGTYLNFPGFFEQGEELLRSSYGEENYERLVALRDEVDTMELFGPLGGVNPRS